MANVDPRVNGPGERNSQRAAHIHIHDVGNPVVRGETHDEEIVIRLKRLRVRLAGEVAQRVRPHVPDPAVHILRDGGLPVDSDLLRRVP